MIEESPGLYLRYSEGPEKDWKAGPSTDYESGQEMPGWSVTTVDPEPWWTRPAADWIARRMSQYAQLAEESDRFPWLLRGRREPLVDGLAPVARVGRRALDEALTRYRERFDVGNDSRTGA